MLRLLASELSGPEIARHLVVSLNTVRTHTKNIYAKLGRHQPAGRGPACRGARPARPHAHLTARQDHHLVHHMW